MKNWWFYNRPPFATFQGWARYRRSFRKEAPIRYFFAHFLPRLFRREVVSRTSRIIWFFKYRFHPRHRYNIVRTDLKPGYHDLDSRMLHAVFALICEYVEISLGAYKGGPYRSRQRGVETLQEMIASPDPSDPERNQFNRDLLDLYLWWKDEYQAKEEALCRHYGSGPDSIFFGADDIVGRIDYIGLPLPTLVEIQFNAWKAEGDRLEKALDNEIDSKLRKAIEIRRILWT